MSGKEEALSEKPNHTPAPMIAPDTQERLEEFNRHILPSSEPGKTGVFIDEFGGELHFVYRSPDPETPSSLADRYLELGVNKAALEQALPQAIKAYADALPKVLQLVAQEALIEHAAPVLDRALNVRVKWGAVHSPETTPVKVEYQVKKGVLERKVVEQQGRGRHSLWSKEELESVVQGALAMLPNQLRTYKKVTTVLKSAYGRRAPKSPEALRKLLERLEIDWKELKSG